MDDGIFGGFFAGVGDLLGKGVDAATSIFQAREARKVEEARTKTAVQAAILGEKIGLEQLRILALAIAGLAALFLLTRKARRA